LGGAILNSAHLIVALNISSATKILRAACFTEFDAFY